MPKVGDQVKLRVRGPAILSGGPGTASINIPSKGEIEVPGEIIEDRGTFWLIKLGIGIGEKNLIPVPKTALVVSHAELDA